MRFPAPAAVKRMRALAVALAELNRIEIDETANLLLPRRHAYCLVTPTAELAIVPFAPPGVGMARAALDIASLCHGDVIAVTIGVDPAGVETPYFGVALGTGNREWLGGYRLWCRDREGPYWLVPDVSGPIFRLSATRLASSPAPWTKAVDHNLGFNLAHLALIGLAARHGYEERIDA